MAWQNNPTNFTLQILKDATELQRKIAGAMLQQVILRSPVDSGAFRSNHRVSLRIIDKSFDKKSTGNDALAKGMATILQAKLGHSIYIQNNLPYGIRLERGWSQQAPLGIYSLSFQSVMSKYK